MTVSTTDSVIEYVSGGPAFPIPYRFLQNSDIEAVLIKQDGTSETLVLGTQFTLTGAGSQSGGTLTSAYAAGYLATPGALLTISRIMQAVQPTDLRNQGRFLAETHETVFDRLTMLIQQAFSILRRALLRPIGRNYYDAEGRQIKNLGVPTEAADAVTKAYADSLSAGNIQYTDAQMLRTVRAPQGETLSQMPGASSRADRILAFDAAGNPILVIPASGSASDLALDLANRTLSYKGAGMIGYRGRTQYDKNGERLTGADVGVVADGATLNNTAMANLAAEARAKKQTAILGPGLINLSVVSLTGTDRFALRGEGNNLTTFNRVGASNLLNFQGLDGLSLSDFTIEMNKALSTDNGHGIVLIDQPHSRVKNISVKSHGGIGTGVIAYSTDINVRRENIVFEDIYVSGDFDNSDNTNGTLIDNGVFSRQSGIFCKGIKEYAIEYKNNTRYSLLSDIIAFNSGYAVGYGQTTLDDTGVSSCVATGIVSLACNTGIVVGKGDLNVFSGAMINSTGTTGAQKRGIITALGADQNMFVGILTAGDMLEPVRWQANRNYAQVASHDTATYAVTMTAGAEKNVTEIAHPGRRTSILSAILNVSGNPLSGDKANPVYCHATGDYVGTLSGRWRYRHDVSGASPLSAARHVLESVGNTAYGVATDGVGYAGLQVATPTKNAFAVYYAATGDWQIGDNSFSLKIAPAATAPSTDNAMSFGDPAHRASAVYAGTGSIITSDLRDKQDESEILEAESRACAKINAIRYRLKDAVSSKGDGARWHFGVGAQQVKEAFESEGLDPFAYALLCYDEWPATDAVYEVHRLGRVFFPATPESEEVTLYEGVEESMATEESLWEFTHEETVMTKPATPAGNRYGVRYDELLMLMTACLARKLAD